jgi:predicted AlkP superfamily pyrophosphatase or phosphodiesterase
LKLHPFVRVAALTLALAACGAPPVENPPPAPTAGGTGGLNRPEHRDKPYLILVSFDGFRPDYVDRFDLPNFRRAAQDGARADALLPVFPTVTFTNHYSLVTGLYADRHGIVGNSFYDPDRRATYSFRDASVGDGSWYGGEPIWVTAEKQGMVAACFFWPGSEAAIGGVRPTFWNKYDGKISNDTRVGTVLEWLRLPEDRRPHVITVYFNELDTVSHRNALDSPAIEAAAKSLDRALGALRDGVSALPIRDRVYFLLTSDHGMVETSLSRTIVLASLIDTTRVRIGFSGPMASLHTIEGGPSAQQIKDRINARLRHGRAYLREELPGRLHFTGTPRAGDVVVIMDESWTLAANPPPIGAVRERWGNHGWDPAAQSMRALFMITGPEVRRGLVVPAVENVDVYPLMTELLGLRPADGIDGTPGRIRALVSGTFSGIQPIGTTGHAPAGAGEGIHAEERTLAPKVESQR